jgi:hypothetical protein
LPITEGFVYPVKWHPTDEQGTNFIKATNDVGSIAAFMRKVVRMSKRDMQEAGEKGRDWAVKTFGIETIGAQWEKLFSTLPADLDWSSVDITAAPPKNPAYRPAQDIADNVLWLKDIYKGILLMDVGDGDSGLSHWLSKLQAGVTREAIQAYFVSVAQGENAKAGGGATVDFGSLIDKTTGRKRAIFIIKESIGDCLICTQLFESFHKKYPQHDLYVMTDPKYIDVFVGNPFIYKVLPFIPAAENEMIMTGAGQKERYFDVYFHAGILTQRQLFYLTPKD